MRLSSRLSELALTIAFPVSIATALKNDSCWFPDNKSRAVYNGLNFVQCKETSEGGVTYCCNPNDICTSAGYCVGGAGVFYRGGCTDKTWTSSLCPALCAKVNMDSFANFYPCIPGQFSHENWTCDKCDSSTFHFDPGDLFVPQLEAVTATSTVTVISSASGSAATSTVTVISSASGSVSALPIVESCPTHNGSLIGLGVGLGIALAISAIVSLYGFFFERQRRKRAEKSALQAHTSGYDPRTLKEYSNSNMAQEASSQPLHEFSNDERTQEAGSQEMHEIGI